MAGLFRAISLGEISRSEFDGVLTQKSLTLVYLGIGAYVATYVGTAGFMAIGERLTRRVCREYFRALLRQNMAFVDGVGPGVLSSRITLDCQSIQEGISEKVAFVITALASLISAYAIGFVKYWKLTLVASSILVFIVGASATCTRFIIKFRMMSMASYSVAGGLADEVITSVRTVKILGARGVISSRFDLRLDKVEAWGRKAQMVVAMLVATATATTFMSHALTFWTGSIFIGRGEASLSDVITVAFAILIGSHVFSGIAPHIPAFAGAVAAASKVYSVVDRESPWTRRRRRAPGSTASPGPSTLSASSTSISRGLNRPCWTASTSTSRRERRRAQAKAPSSASSRGFTLRWAARSCVTGPTSRR